MRATPFTREASRRSAKLYRLDVSFPNAETLVATSSPFCMVSEARRCCLHRCFSWTENFTCRVHPALEKMTQFLPPNLLALFAPRDPIPYLPPVNKLPHEKKNGGYIGVGTFLKYFEVTKMRTQLLQHILSWKFTSHSLPKHLETETSAVSIKFCAEFPKKK